MATTDPGAAPRLPTIRGLRAQAPRLVIDWKGGPRGDAIDFTGLIACDKLFEPLADPARFNAVEIIDWGVAVSWGDGVELSGSTLRRWADAQRRMSPEEFAAFQEMHGLSNQETADLIERSLSIVKDYKSGRQPIPFTVAATLRAMDDPIIFAAHYRPTAKPGRPRKRA